MQASLHWFLQRAGLPPVHKTRIATTRRKLHRYSPYRGLILPLPTLRITSPPQRRATAWWLHLMPQRTGQGQNQEEIGMHPAGPGSAQGWRGFATSELDERLGTSIPGRNALSSPGHRGKRRCLVAEEKLMVEKAWGSNGFLKPSQ